MSLKKCNDCNEEISIFIDKCPKCGSKKPFKNIKLTLDETKELDGKEKKQFIKLGGKISYSKLHKFFAFFIYGFIGIIFMIVFLSKDNNEQEKIESLKATIKSLPMAKVEENYDGYKKLSAYYPEDKQYKEKLDFYKSRVDMSAECQYLAKRNNKSSLNNPSTYDDSLLDSYLSIQWNSTDEYIFQSSFSGKNAFGVEQKFVTKYKCTYNNGKTSINQVYLKKATD